MTNQKTYAVYLFNLGYYLQETYKTNEEAQAAGRKSGFEFWVEVEEA